MKIYFKNLIAALLVPCLLLACKKTTGDTINNGGPGPTTGGAKAHFIQGEIFDANGHKFNISNSSVTVHAWGPGLIGESDRMYNIAMDSKAHYEAQVIDGLYAFHAYARMPLNGQIVMIDLESLDNISYSVQQASAPGIVKNFGLKLSGLKKEGDPNDANSYFGGHVSIADGAANFTSDGYWNNLAVNYPGAMISFILTPKGPCVDGSAAPTKQIDCSVEDLQQGRYLVDFPYAYYRLTAVLRTAQGAQKQLRLTFIPGATGPHYDALDLTFSPDPSDPDGHPYNPYVAVWQD